MMRSRVHPGNPPAPAPAWPNEPTATYLHHARRLRGRFAGEPATLHQRLRDLSQAVDAETVKQRRPPSLSADSPEAWEFARQVAAQLQSEQKVLRYSYRIKLLQQAARMGIGRFEANLIIAVAEHRLRDADGCNASTGTPRPYKRWAAPAVAAVGVQAALLALAYWIGLMPL